MKKIFCFLILLFSINVFSQQLNIIPKPVNIVLQNGKYTITPKTKIIAATENVKLLSYINDYLLSNYGYKLMVANKLNENGIKLITGTDKQLQKGGYRMSVNKEGINISGDSEGLFRELPHCFNYFLLIKKWLFL